VNHRIGFVDPTTGAHTNTIESYWRHLKVYVDPYNRKKGYELNLAQYMFMARCKADNVDPFTMFCTSPRLLIGAVSSLIP
jgi:hypothetical protein